MTKRTRDAYENKGKPQQRPQTSRLTSSLTKRTQTAHEDTVAQAVQLAASAFVPTFRGCPLHEHLDQTNPVGHENKGTARQNPTLSSRRSRIEGVERRIQNEPRKTSGSSSTRKTFRMHGARPAGELRNEPKRGPWSVACGPWRNEPEGAHRQECPCYKQ